jgi:hypothetical protein
VATKSIIQIDVAADSFKAFVEIFNKYNETLEHQPEAVKKLEEALDKAGKAGQKLSHTMNPGAKRPGSGGSGGGENPKDDLENRAKRGTNALAKLAEQIKRTDASMLAMFKNADKAKSSSGIFKLLLGGAGIEGIATLAGGPAGMITALAGMAATAAAYKAGQVVLGAGRNVSQTAQSAFGANMGYGAYQNATAQLSPFMDNPGAALQNLAIANFSPQSQGMLGLFGVSPGMSKQQQLKQILLTGADDLRASHNLNTPTAMYERQLLGISSTQEISLMNQKRSDLVKAFNKMSNGALNNAQNVSGDTISKDNQMLADWQANMNKAGATFDTALSLANPLVTDFGNAVGGASVDVRAFGQMLSALTGKPSAAASAASGADSGATSSGIQPALSVAAKGGDISAIVHALKPNEMNSIDAIMGQYEKDGYSKKFAAAMASQARSESSFNPNATNYYKGQEYKGLFQWNASRRAAILKATGIDVWKASAADQVKASIWEMHHTEQAAAAKINGAKTAWGAGVTADNEWERSGDNWFQQQERGARAAAYYAVGPNPHASSDVHKTLKAIAKQQAKPVKVSLSVTNSTQSRVEMSSVAAGWG